jgi:flagellar assembly protein FliH
MRIIRREDVEGKVKGFEIGGPKVIEPPQKSEAERAQERAEVLRRECETVRAQAQEKGRQEGFEKGLAEGRAQLTASVSAVNELLRELHAVRERTLKESEKDIVDLVLKITQKVVRVSRESDRQIVVNAVTSTIPYLVNKGSVTIRVNPEDVAAIEEAKLQIAAVSADIGKVEVLKDNAVSRGSCLLETACGSVDADIDVLLATIETQLKNVAATRNV